jgi:hypothetical protein
MTFQEEVQEKLQQGFQLVPRFLDGLPHNLSVSEVTNFYFAIMHTFQCFLVFLEMQEPVNLVIASPLLN